MHAQAEVNIEKSRIFQSCAMRNCMHACVIAHACTCHTRSILIIKLRARTNFNALQTALLLHARARDAQLKPTEVRMLFGSRFRLPRNRRKIHVCNLGLLNTLFCCLLLPTGSALSPWVKESIRANQLQVGRSPSLGRERWDTPGGA